MLFKSSSTSSRAALANALAHILVWLCSGRALISGAGAVADSWAARLLNHASLAGADALMLLKRLPEPDRR
jgi:dihydrodipicolinate synthase/N-acetylneuraminate lyase